MLPVLGALVLQAAYGAVDLLVVGHFGSTSGLSAVSTGSQVLNLVTFVVTQLAMGVTVLIARYLREKRPEQIGSVIGGAAVIFTLLSAVLFVGLVGFARLISVLMQAPAEAVNLTASYVRICGGGIFFIVAYNLFSAIFRGLGDSKSPLLFVLVACVVNIMGDLALVAGLGMDAAGAAIATVLAQAVSVVLAVVLLLKKHLPLTLRRAEAAGGAQAHIDDVRAQGHSVVRRRQDIVPGSAVGAAGAEHLHGQDLGLGRDAHHVIHHTGIACGDAGHMGAVVTGTSGIHVQVVVGVVKGKGDLCAVIHLAGGDARLLLLRLQVLGGENGFNVLFIQGRAGGVRPEQGVADLQTAVHDGDDHALALIAGVVFQAAQLRGGGFHIRRYLKFRSRIGGGHAGQGPDLIQLAVGHLDGKAVGGCRVGVQDLHRGAVQHLAGDLLLHSCLLAQHHRPVLDLAAAAALRHHRLGLQGNDDGNFLFRANGVHGFHGLQSGVP